MSEKDPHEGPERQAPDEITPEQRMLFDIMDQSIAKCQETPEPDKASEDLASDQEPDVSRETSETQEKAPPPPQKNSPSSFYRYLLVLFGAAFLMLLLAYFVQQRNSDAVQDDLELLTASREELLEQIKELEEANHDLAKDNGLLKYERSHYQELYEKAQDTRDGLSGQLQHTQAQFNATVILGYLERFCGERDYLMAAVVVEQCDQYFNEHNKFYGNCVPIPAAMVSRYFRLREDVVMEKAQCMVTEQYYGQDQESYTEEVRIVPSASRYSEEAVRAARTLWSIFWNYPDSVEMTAWQMAQFCAPGSDGLYQLNSRAFQPSTRELFEEIKEDLIAQGLVTEEDGALTANVSQDGPVADMDLLESDPAKVILY